MLARQPALVLAATVTLSVGVAEATGKTYTFVNTATKQEIQVECSADPRRYSQDWWKANCKPLGRNAAGWTGSSVDSHPDFLWRPTNLGAGGGDDE